MKKAMTHAFFIAISCFMISDESTPTTCPKGWLMHDDSCFKAFRTRMNWYDARDYCISHNGRLAWIKNMWTHSFVINHFEIIHSDMYIGLNDVPGDNEYHWQGVATNASKMSFTPNKLYFTSISQRCVVLRNFTSYHRWASVECDLENDFLCQKPPSVAITCGSDWHQYGKSCFKQIKIVKSWSEAREHCLNLGADLATVPDKETKQFLRNTFLFRSVDSYIGLNDRDKEGTYIWVATGEEAVYTNWEHTQPNNYKDQDCVAFWKDKNGLWSDESCDRTKYFLCEKHNERALDCPGDWDQYNQSCFKLFTTKQNWYEARDHCKSIDADLATIPDVKTNEFLTQNFPENGNMFIGLSDTRKKNNFVWDATGQDLTTFQNWGSGQPNKKLSCAILWYGERKKWRSTDCNQPHNYLCESTPGRAQHCRWGWHQFKQNCFKVITTKLNWHEAKDYCWSENGHLATIPDQFTRHFVKSVFPTGVYGEMYIGLNNLYRDGVFRWHSNGEIVTLTDWRFNQPVYTQTRNCTKLMGKKLGQWATQDCSVPKAFICEIPHKPDFCKSGWHRHRQSCYSLFLSSLNWYDARDLCRQQGNGFMATIPDEDTDQFIRTMYPTTVHDIYIGLSDTLQDRKYQWEGTKENITYSNWSPGLPNNIRNKDCVFMSAKDNGKWVNGDCSDRHYVLCEMQEARPEPCQQGWIQHGDSCFKQFGIKRNWFDARDYCRSQDGYLATISDKETSDFLDGTYPTSYYGDLYIGLNDIFEENSFEWEGTGEELTNKPSYKNWGRGQPNNYKNQDCVALWKNGNGKWADEPCHLVKSFICEIPPPSFQPCPSGWIRHNRSCFKVFEKRLNWWDARDVCWSHDGFLATIHNNQTSKFLKSTFPTSYYGSLYIGLNDLAKEGEYRWSHNKHKLFGLIDLGPIHPNNPNDHDCVQLWEANDGNWADASCYVHKAFICEIPPPSAIGCPRGWAFHGKSCFQLHRVRMKWSDARDICKDEGANLASVLNNATTQFLKITFPTDFYGDIWTGMNDIKTEGIFVHDATKRAIVYENWAYLQPDNWQNNEDCVMLWRTQIGKWADAACVKRNSFLCETPSFQCGDRVGQGNGGKIRSPNYPNQYPNNVRCHWEIDAGKGFGVVLRFPHPLQLEMVGCDDYVKVGRIHDNGTLIAERNYCNVTRPPTLFSLETSIVVLEFVSDTSLTGNGFEAYWYKIDIDECLFDNGGCKNKKCIDMVGYHVCV